MEWLEEEVMAGVTRLLSLKLKNQPGENEIRITLEEWVRSLTRNIGRPIDKIDTPRIRAGFDRLIDHCEWWPAPADLYKSIPRRTERLALPVPDIDEAGMERGKKRLAEIMKKIDGYIMASQNELIKLKK